MNEEDQVDIAADGQLHINTYQLDVDEVLCVVDVLLQLERNPTFRHALLKMRTIRDDSGRERRSIPTSAC